MSFALLEYDPKPIKLKGEKVITAIAIPLRFNLVKAGIHKGVYSGMNINLKSGGLLTLTKSSDKINMSVMGITLDQTIFSIDDPLSEIFIPIDSNFMVQSFQYPVGVQIKKIEGSWIPSQQYKNDNIIAEGWFKLIDGDLKIVMLSTNPLEITLDGLKVESRYCSPQISFKL